MGSMIEVLLSLAGLPLLALFGVIMFLGSLLTGSLTLLSVLITAPFLIAFSLLAVGPALGIKAVTSILEEHPELVALGALILGIVFGLYYMLRNNNNRNGNGINGFRINSNGLNNKNGISGANGVNSRNSGIKKNDKIANGKNGIKNGRTNGKKAN